jgi:hypothetical protein
MPNESVPDDSLFLISTSDPWYGDITLYLQMQHFRPDLFHEYRRRIIHDMKHYLIIGYPISLQD